MDFQSTPLITPERLQDNLADCFDVRPQWAGAFALADPSEPDHTLNKIILLPPSDGTPSESLLTPTQTVILFEATRYGHKVEVNSDGKGRFYTKLVFTGLKHDGSKAREDNVITARVFEGAGGANRVWRNSNNPKDQTEGLKTTGAVTDGSDRAKVILLSAKASREANRTEEQTYQYIGNLIRLLQMHDSYRKGEVA